MNIRSGKGVAALGVSVLTLSLIAVAGASPATAGPAAAPTVERAYFTMRVIGFDAQVAAMNGYQIKRHPDGREYSVKMGDKAGMPALDGGLLPANEVAGNCGTSWIEFDAIGGLAAQLGTGFDVPLPASGYTWKVNVTDQIGTGVAINESRFLNPHRKSWAKVVTTRSGARGSAFSQVVTPTSVATLENGAVCRSGGPTSYTNYY